MKESVFDRRPPARRGVRRLLAGALALAASLIPIAPLAAQTGVVAGTVVGVAGQPVSGALIRVSGTQLGTSSDANGRFRIPGLTGDSVTLEVRRIGYRAERVPVSVGNPDVRVTLTEQSVILDEVVVTGTTGGQARREIGTAVTTINASATKEIAPINSVQNLLNGRAPGVFIQSAGGQVGTGARVRIRGASSIALSNEPLLYVDGVRVNNTPASGPLNQAFGSASISRMNDINPDDIESIEVIKGPAAATLYGTEASNGVIQIITKKGTTGAPRWALSTRVGTSYIPDPEGRFPVNWGTVPHTGGTVGRTLDTVSIDIIDREKALGNEVFRNGLLQEYDLSASGGSNQFTYYAGAGLENTEGIEPTSGVKRYSGRLNLSIVPRETFTISANMGFVNGRIDVPCEGGCGGRLLGTIWANPANAVPLADGSPNPRRGYHTGLPYMYDQLVQYWQTVNRFTGGVQVSHSPLSWFQHRLSTGTDRVTEGDHNLGLRSEDPLTRTLLGGNGNRTITSRQVDYSSVDYSASAIAQFAAAFKSTTSFGAQYYRNSNAFQTASGTVFPTVGLTALSATTTNRTSSGDLTEDATLGFYLQEQLGWKDRLFLTAAVRADDNSAFGQNFDRVYYPKFSASWVISEEAFWTMPYISALRLRAAYGEAGRQPVSYSALQTYASATGPGDVAAVTPQFLGNADLGPERSKEVELGFDLGALDDRVNVELSWYRKRTVDAILDRQIPPSLGLPNTQPFNAGLISNSGLEFLVRATPMQRQNFEWDMTFSLATNDSKVESLGTPQAILDLREATGTPDFVQLPQGLIRHQVGYPIGAFFEQRVVSAGPVQTTGPNRGKIDISTVMCDNGKGGTMLCAGPDLIYNTSDDSPDVFLGRSMPATEGAFSTTFTFMERFRLYGLLDFKTDFKKLDGNVRARCFAFTRCEEQYYPEKFDPRRIAGIQSNNALPDYYISDSDYAKLREVSLAYTLPEISTRWARFNRATVTLAGRNLVTWTKYPGLEPEALFLGGSSSDRGGNFGAWEQNAAPQLTQWVLGLNLGW